VQRVEVDPELGQLPVVDDPVVAEGVLHSLDVVGAEGGATSINDRERVDGPNFNVRKEQREQVLYAIRNGGYSGAIMPENIVVGKAADDIAAFLATYSGRGSSQAATP